MMKTVTSKPDDYTIYCTDADSIHHSLNSIQASELLRQVKICSLLGKHVYVSGGHIFENPETTKLLLDNPALLESGIIVIGLRDDCRDFTDLLEMQSSLGKKLLVNDKTLPNFLNEKTSFIMRWYAPQTQPRFKDCIVASISNPQSTLRKRLRYRTSQSSIRELEKEIAELDPGQVTREILQQLIAKHIPRGHKAFMSEVNLLYYIAGSSDRIPHLNYSLFDDLSKGYINSLDHKLCPIPADKLFSRLLKETLVCEELIDQMTIRDLIGFREKNSGLITRFRAKWWSTFKIQGRDSYDVAEYCDFQELQSLIVDEILKEKIRLKKYNRFEKPVDILSIAIDLASILAGPVLSAIAFIVSGGASSTQKDSIKNRVLKTHFIALASCLRASCISGHAQHGGPG